MRGGEEVTPEDLAYYKRIADDPNPLIDEMVWTEREPLTGHTTTVRTDLPMREWITPPPWRYRVLRSLRLSWRRFLYRVFGIKAEEGK